MARKKYTRSFIEKIRMANPIERVISEYLDLRKTGKDYIGLCPFHKERTPSFRVVVCKDHYFCFGCGCDGDVFPFIMKFKDYSFLEAVDFLGKRAGLIK